ncbi:expressed unknown protein [Seminavis robusta]|uniref:Uncharacterized protein n=2 Tax=Seminavis robusta TaxID=568900 RepID=A0A9N8F0K4_9STRA|nr:expressed unknown protein [Seminavis robusta]|eukprot:Sro2226_g319790.1 n/a (214) ;mRNA; r:316-957
MLFQASLLLLPMYLLLIQSLLLRSADAWAPVVSPRPVPVAAYTREFESRLSSRTCRHSSTNYPRRSLLLRAAEEEEGQSTDDDKLSTLDKESLIEMECFIYSRKDATGTTKLELGVLEESVLQPVCAWTTEEAFDDYIEFVVDEEDRYSVKLEDVTVHSLIPADDLSYGSRQVGGGKGPGNPHGEESELLYYIRKEALEGIEVTVKPELEITW